MPFLRETVCQLACLDLLRVELWPRLPLDGPDSSDSSPGSEGRALAILASTRSKITEWFCRLSGSEKFADSFDVLEAGGRGRYPPLLRVFIGPRLFCFFSLPRTHATSLELTQPPSPCDIIKQKCMHASNYITIRIQLLYYSM